MRTGGMDKSLEADGQAGAPADGQNAHSDGALGSAGRRCERGAVFCFGGGVVSDRADLVCEWRNHALVEAEHWELVCEGAGADLR